MKYVVDASVGFKWVVPEMLDNVFALLGKAYAISSQMRVGIFDCLYVALAEREGCELVTADSRLVNALHKQYPFVVELAALP
jgi:predicted nucleic acid-binding protein